MKKNVLNTMNRLKIDEEIRGLIRQLWKHNYKTKFSCSGHSIEDESYLVFMENTGDGWFEKNAEKYGLKYKEKHNCCDKVDKIDEELSKKYPGYSGAKFCRECGYAFNGMKRYDGTLVPDPFNPLYPTFK